MAFVICFVYIYFLDLNMDREPVSLMKEESVPSTGLPLRILVLFSLLEITPI